MGYTLGRISSGARGNIPMAGAEETLATVGTGTIWLVGAGVIALLWWLAKQKPEDEVVVATQEPRIYE